VSSDAAILDAANWPGVRRLVYSYPNYRNALLDGSLR
jgi:hypothetical protein